MTKYTPGPWRVPTENGCYVSAENGYQICSLDPRHNRRIDADLIAAAPELLQSVKDLLPILESGIKEPWVLKAQLLLERLDQ